MLLFVIIVLRNGRIRGPAERCALWTTTPATSVPTCDRSAHRYCRFAVIAAQGQ
jgi:hypothetical protein